MLKENEVAKVIVDVAYHIHRNVGPGLLESVYHAIMKYELEKRGLHVLSREPVPIVWENVRLDLAFQADLIVEDVVVVELKSVEQMARVYKMQLLTYLRLTNCRLGLLMNFGDEVRPVRTRPTPGDRIQWGRPQAARPPAGQSWVDNARLRPSRASVICPTGRIERLVLPVLPRPAAAGGDPRGRQSRSAK